MATELNVEVLTGMGFTVPEGAGPNDLVIALRATDDAALAAGLAAVEAALADLRRGSASAGELGSAPDPLTLGAAVRRAGAGLVVVSVPGSHAVTRSLRCHRRLRLGHALLGQRQRGRRDRPQGRRCGGGRARHGPGLWHRGRQRSRARLRQRRAARVGRDRGRVRHRRPTGHVPPRRRRCRDQPLPGCRRTGPQARGRRPLHPPGAARTGRRPRHRVGHRGPKPPDDGCSPRSRPWARTWA